MTAPTPIRVTSIADYALGRAIAERHNLWAPLEGERLLDFLENLTVAHDCYVEALNDPLLVLRDIFRPPTTDEQYQRCWDAACAMLTKHRSIDKVLELTEYTFSEFRSVLRPLSQDYDPTKQGVHNITTLNLETWREAEATLNENPKIGWQKFYQTTSVSRNDANAFRELYGIMPATEKAFQHQAKLTEPARKRMHALLVEGKMGTEIASIIKQEFGITISRSLTTQMRKRMTAKGLL